MYKYAPVSEDYTTEDTMFATIKIFEYFLNEDLAQNATLIDLSVPMCSFYAYNKVQKSLCSG